MALHVGAHQSAVGVIMFEERNQPCDDGNELLRRHVHVGHLCCINLKLFTMVTRPADRLFKHVVLVKSCGRLSDNAPLFLVGGHVLDLFRDDPIADDRDKESR